MATNNCDQVLDAPNHNCQGSPEYDYGSPYDEHRPAFFSSSSPTTAVQVADLSPLPQPVMLPSMPSSAPTLRTRVSFSRQTPASNQPSIQHITSKTEKARPSGKVTLKDRIACYHWSFFAMTMATGGVANVLHASYYRADWITILGLCFCLLNMALFVMNCILLSCRFYLRPGAFTSSFTDQVESLFIPAFFVSIAMILINISEYAVPHCGPWLLQTLQVCFWIYVGLSGVASAGLYLILWSTLNFPIHMMTPTWVFPAYPLLLTGPFAAHLIDSADVAGHPLSINKTAIALCATATQGTGCLIAFMISAAFIYRLMTQKLPRDMQRPGVFISVGPFAFTAAGIVQLGSQAKAIIPDHFLDTTVTADVIKVVSLLVGLWLWGLAMWFFLVSIGSLWKYTRAGQTLPFQMTWWSFVFPNTALVVATETMGDVFDNKAVHIFGAVLTVCLIVAWMSVLVAMLRCLWTRKLLWPQDVYV
ncbi:hypothetical protein E4U15_007653 [Claviceps sp. LM218 group G6]|nr:hypothetical protein E4U15_007653 [Claviceps sp. LM218 group G6]